jgi:Na+/H+ antiporter NhaB
MAVKDLFGALPGWTARTAVAALTSLPLVFFVASPAVAAPGWLAPVGLSADGRNGPPRPG